MMKAFTISLACAVLLALESNATAQNSAKDDAVRQAILNQQSTILLRQKLVEAKAAMQRNDTAGAAKLYQEAFKYTKEIGSGIDAETAQTKAGLATTRLALARAAQSRGDYREAGVQIAQVLNADPKNVQGIALKKQNDQMLAAMQGHIPSAATVALIPDIMKEKVNAGTLVQDGKLLYEAGKLEEAELKLKEGLKLDPDNSGAYTYLNLIKQSKLLRESAQHAVDTQDRMASVEKQWVLPKPTVTLAPYGNPYATNTMIYTGPGRQMIVEKLNRIRLESVTYDGVPLSEVLRQLSEKSRLADPDRKGINFLINPNPDQSGQAIAAPTGGFGGIGGPLGAAPAAGIPAAVDPQTGLPVAGPGGATGGGGNSTEALDAGAFTVKLSLVDVRLTDVLAAIMDVAQNPNPGDQRTIKYTIKDYGIVFQAKGVESPQMFTREFKVDPNTFYSGLESVSATSFGGSGTSSGGGGGGGGGGSRGGGGGGGGNQQGGGAVVGVVNPFAGGGSLRNQGGQGGGGGGGGGGGQGGGSLLNATGAGGAAGGGGGGQQNQGGLNYITTQTSAATPSSLAIHFFTTLGVNLSAPPGKSVFFNDKSGKLLVRATEQDLDTIEQAIHALNEVSPQVHIKTRFIEVQQKDNKALGFDWYLGNFINGNLIGNGGSAPSLNSRVDPIANPLGAFPGNTTASLIPGSASDQLVTGGLRNSGPALATLTGILTDPNFRVVLRALEQRGGFESLGEPEVTTTSGRQTQMRATQIINVVTGFSFDNGSAGQGSNQGGNTGGGTGNGNNQTINPGTSSVSPSTQPVETGPILDVVPYVLSDGYTINMALIPSLTDFNGYDTISAGEIPGYNPGTALAGANNGTTLPVALPKFTVRQVVTTVNVWDNQTVALGGLITSTVQSTKDKVPVLGDIPMLGRLFQSQAKTTIKNNLMIFVTATIVDPAGNRVHSDDDLPFAQATTPTQPEGYGVLKEAGSQKVSAAALAPKP